MYRPQFPVLDAIAAGDRTKSIGGPVLYCTTMRFDKASHVGRTGRWHVSRNWQICDVVDRLIVCGRNNVFTDSGAAASAGDHARRTRVSTSGQ